MLWYWPIALVHPASKSLVGLLEKMEVVREKEIEKTCLETEDCGMYRLVGEGNLNRWKSPAVGYGVAAILWVVNGNNSKEWI